MDFARSDAVISGRFRRSPEVDVTAERVAVSRRYSRRAYQAGAVLSLIAMVQAVIVVSAAGGAAWLWVAAAVLAASAAVFTYKSVPLPGVVFK
jgi:uncharacterized membrane protein YdbT with pleckstrin-like domain